MFFELLEGKSLLNYWKCILLMKLNILIHNENAPLDNLRNLLTIIQVNSPQIHLGQERQTNSHWPGKNPTLIRILLTSAQQQQPFTRFYLHLCENVYTSTGSGKERGTKLLPSLKWAICKPPRRLRQRPKQLKVDFRLKNCSKGRRNWRRPKASRW